MKKYTAYAYVKKLERCLRKASYEERLDAVNYYSEYLAEAGPEREREVIERLGPPQRVAAEIRADAALRELNAKAEFAERARAARKAKKAAGRARGATAGVETRVYDVEDVANGGPGAAGYANGPLPDSAASVGGEYGADPQRPGMGESFSAAGLGALGMLSMPIARPLAVLACVLGVFGLVLGVIVVVAVFAAAGGIALAGAFSFVVSFFVFPQDISVFLFFAGAGTACVGAGLIVGALNYLLGRVIFKGIANLSGRIRHKRVKVRRETFNYSHAYAYTDEAAGMRGAYGAGANGTNDGKDENHERQA